MASARHRRFALLAIGLGTSLPAADTAVNVALPAIADALLSDPLAIRWTVIVYVLTYACLMMLIGAWGDRKGYWRVFRLGLWTGVIAYGICSLASDYLALLIGRGLQGFSTALLLSVGPALMVLVFAADQQGADQQRRGVAAYGALSSAAAALGPLVGGLMIHALGWAGVFWFRFPAALLALFCLGLAGTETRNHDDLGRNRATFQALARRTGQSAFGLLAQSFSHQCAATLIRAHALHAWAQCCGFTSMLLIPFLMVHVMHQAAASLGLVLFAWPAGMALGNSLGPGLIRRIGILGGMRVGIGILALGGISLALFCSVSDPQQGPYEGRHALALALALGIQGAGLGLFQMIYTDWVLAQSAASERGVAGAASLTSRTCGVIVAALLWPDLTSQLAQNFNWTWSEALALIYGCCALSLFGLLSQTTRRSLRM